MYQPRLGPGARFHLALLVHTPLHYTSPLPSPSAYSSTSSSAITTPYPFFYHVDHQSMAVLPTVMSYPDDRPGTGQGVVPGTGSGPGTYYSRPPSSHSHAATSSSHGLTHQDGQSQSQSSPDRNSSSHSHGFSKSLPGTTPQTPSYHDIPNPHHGYPATPVSASGPSYPPPTEHNYYETQVSHDGEASDGSPQEGRIANFTPDGNPIVPVGISGGKMFQCRGYGICDKVFTRSEHLARHVRYVLLLRPMDVADNQKTYRRKTIPMSLWKSLFPTR
jgi:hypothetical protein